MAAAAADAAAGECRIKINFYNKILDILLLKSSYSAIIIADL